jgi:hypothetical protein
LERKIQKHKQSQGIAALYTGKVRKNVYEYKKAQGKYNGKEKRECAEAKSRLDIYFLKRNANRVMYPSVKKEHQNYLH